jgi:hypothetical protein
MEKMVDAIVEQCRILCEVMGIDPIPMPNETPLDNETPVDIETPVDNETQFDNETIQELTDPDA